MTASHIDFLYDSGSSDISEDAPEDRKYKKSLDTDTTEVERKSDVSEESDGSIDVVDDSQERLANQLPMKLLSAQTIEEDLSST